jgi:hypothetical protein
MHARSRQVLRSSGTLAIGAGDVAITTRDANRHSAQKPSLRRAPHSPRSLFREPSGRRKPPAASPYTKIIGYGVSFEASAGPTGPNFGRGFQNYTATSMAVVTGAANHIRASSMCLTHILVLKNPLNLLNLA